MPLPTIVAKTTPIMLPITLKTINVKQMIVSQQIAMMEAHETKNTAKQVGILKDILNGDIVQDDANVKIGKQVYDEAEYLLLVIRGISTSDPTVLAKMPNDPTIYTVNLLADIGIVGGSRPGYIEIPGDTPIKIKMGIPTMAMVDRQISLNGNLSQAEQAYGLILSCIESIADQNGITTVDKDITQKELREFIGSFSATMFEPITKFFSEIPQVTMRIGETKNITGLAGIFESFAAANEA